MKTSVLVALLLLGPAAIAATPGTEGTGALPCDPMALEGEIAAQERSVSALETQIKAIQSQRATAQTQLNALNNPDPIAVKQRTTLKQQVDDDTGHIAMLEKNANMLRDHVAALQAKRASCGARQQTATP